MNTLQLLVLIESNLTVLKCHNVFGLTLQSNLKWNIFIERTTSKASKRLHILRVLKRNGVNVADLLTVYKSLVRSVLEYCAPVWHTSIPAFLSDEVEIGRGPLCEKVLGKAISWQPPGE